MSIKTFLTSKAGLAIIAGAGFLSVVAAPLQALALSTYTMVGNYIMLGTLQVNTLAPGGCVTASAAGKLSTTGAACGSGGGGGVTSVTSSNTNLIATPNTGSVVLTALENPTYTGTVTAPLFSSTNTGTNPQFQWIDGLANPVYETSGGGKIVSSIHNLEFGLQNPAGIGNLLSLDDSGNFAVAGSFYSPNLPFGQCLSAGSQGRIIGSGASCASGTVTAVTASGNLASSGGNTPNVTVTDAPTFAGPVTAANIIDTALTSGNCVQAGAGGLLTTTGSACGSGGGGGGVTSASNTDGNLAIAPATGAAVFNLSPVITVSGSGVGAINVPNGYVLAGIGGTSNSSKGFALGATTGVYTYITACQSPDAACTVGDIVGTAISFSNNTATQMTEDSSGDVAFNGYLELPNSLTSGDCVEAGANGRLQSTGSPCGGSGAVTSVTNTDTNLTISPTTGAVVANLSPSIALSGSVSAASAIISGNVNSATDTVTGNVNAGSFSSTGLVSGQCLTANGGNVITSVGENCPFSYLNGTRLIGQHLEMFNNAAIANGAANTYTFGVGYSIAIPACVVTQNAAATTVGGLWVSGETSTTVTITNNTGVSQTPTVNCNGA